MSISIYLSEVLGYILASFIAPTLWIALCFKSTWKGGAWGLFHGVIIMMMGSVDAELVVANIVAGFILGFVSTWWKKEEISEPAEQKDKPTDSAPVKPNAVSSWPTVLILTTVSVGIIMSCFYFYGFERTGQHQAGKTGLEGWSESERRNMVRNADRMAQQFLENYEARGRNESMLLDVPLVEPGQKVLGRYSKAPPAQAAEQQKNTIESPVAQQKTDSSEFKAKLDFYWEMVRNLLN